MLDKHNCLQLVFENERVMKRKQPAFQKYEFYFYFEKWFVFTKVIIGPVIHQVTNQNGSNGRLPNIIRISSIKLLNPKTNQFNKFNRKSILLTIDITNQDEFYKCT